MRFSSHILIVPLLSFSNAAMAQPPEKNNANPLELRLIARRTVYPVSKAPGEGVCFVAMDAELKNTGRQKVFFLAAPEPELVLTGPRAESVRSRRRTSPAADPGT